MNVATLMIIFACFICMSAGRRHSRHGRHLGEFRDRRDRRDSGEEPGRVTELLTEMSSRIDRLEEERDFYRELMGSEVSLRR